MRTQIARIALATALCASLGASATLAGSATVAAGDRVHGQLGEGESDTLTFFVAAPSSLEVRMRLDASLRVDVLVSAPDGSALDVSTALKKPLSRRPALRSLPLTQAGVYHVVIAQATLRYSSR